MLIKKSDDLYFQNYLWFMPLKKKTVQIQLFLSDSHSSFSAAVPLDNNSATLIIIQSKVSLQEAETRNMITCC